MYSIMITLEEVKKKYLNSKHVSQFNKTLFRLGIIKLENFRVSSLNPNDINVTMKFVYWNPLTYIYLLMMSVFVIPFSLWSMGIKRIYEECRRELVDGFEEFL